MKSALSSCEMSSIVLFLLSVDVTEDTELAEGLIFCLELAVGMVLFETLCLPSLPLP